MENLGKIIIGVGITLIIIGLIVWFLGGRLGWFGNLPGDVRVEGERFRFYMPITSMIILSIVLSFILSLLNRFLK